MPDDLAQNNSLESILERLYSGELVVPEFQRDFVWAPREAAQLASSVLKARPIGILTLWDLENAADFRRTPIRIKAFRNQTGNETWPLDEVSRNLEFRREDPRENSKSLAILDGQQRSTALAMVFGGFTTKHRSLSTTGSFFLNLRAADEDEWVVFRKPSSEAERTFQALGGQNLMRAALAKGLLPLAINPAQTDGKWDFVAKGFEAISVLGDPELFTGEEEAPTPNEAELDHWRLRIQKATANASKVSIASYVIDSDFELDEICEIFETLNTAGTKVGTVDLLHSSLFSETQGDEGHELNLRDSIDDIGEMAGAEGWASKDDKPERFVQMVTASYLGLEGEARPETDERFGTWNAGEFNPYRVSSIKAGDLLKTPVAHWQNIIGAREAFVEMIEEFQEDVAGARFPMAWCPYPATASVYAGIAWSKKTEDLEEDRNWDRNDLRALFRSFFWRNALLGRYDQGFLTKVASDIASLRGILRTKGENDPGWIHGLEGALNDLLEDEPTEEEQKERESGLIETIRKGKPRGAEQLALRLIIRTSCQRDLKTGEELAWPSGEADYHHIFPKKWIISNHVASQLTEQAKAQEEDRINCIANLMPLSRKSNGEWREKEPAKALADWEISFDTRPKILEKLFIDQELFSLLAGDGDSTSGEAMETFQDVRAEKIAARVISRMRPSLDG